MKQRTRKGATRLLTAASINFVNDAAQYVSSSTDPVAIGALTDAINKIKAGEVSLIEQVTPVQYLKRLAQQ